MVYGLATEGDAPRLFGRLTSRRVPANALFLSGVFLLSGVVMVAAGDSIVAAFTLVTTISSLCFIFVWTIILVSYLVYRKRRPELHEASKFKMPGGIVMCYVVLAFFAFLIVAFALKEDTLQAELGDAGVVPGTRYRLAGAAASPATSGPRSRIPRRTQVDGF